MVFVYIEGSQVINFNNIVFLSLKICFVIANSEDQCGISSGSSLFAQIPIMGI